MLDICRKRVYNPLCFIWARSAAGSALHSHCRGREFESPRVHHRRVDKKDVNPFFFPDLCPNTTMGNNRFIRCMMGVSKVPSMDMCVPQCPEEWELSALRLVMNPARLSMLRAMRDKPMAVQEVSKQLNLNVGAVSRDINTMRNARLLLVDDSSARSFYSTNLAEIEKIACHVLDWLKNS